MESSGETASLINHTTELNFGQNRPESLKQQLDSLDAARPDQKVFGDFLTALYKPENYQGIDDKFSRNTNVRYQPKFALDGHITNCSIGDISGIYEYQPIAQAVETVEDYFNIFPKIKTVFDQSDGKSNDELVREVAKTITQETDIPVIFTQPSDEKNSPNDWVILENGNVVSKKISQGTIGIHSSVYKGSPEIHADLKEKGYSTKMDLVHPVGDAIIINETKTDDPQAIQTPIHELGHVAEDRYVISKKEEIYSDKSILDTEIISSLYGLKTALCMAEKNPDLAFDMMLMPVSLYNWTMTGTVAP